MCARSKICDQMGLIANLSVQSLKTSQSSYSGNCQCEVTQINEFES